jgi:putative DNA methylase
MVTDDTRLIEDYLPIEAISAEAAREKSVRKGHISTLHLWWARRPLVACRAAVYGALVPAARFVPEGAGDGKKKSLGRANAAKFVDRLCKYPGDHRTIAEAQRHILEAHAERLTRETGKAVTMKDIETGTAPRPKVLDMFAGGGAIPLEALRLGCEAYALDLNPVAHIIELCTLVYQQKYGKPDSTVRGTTGPKNERNETTWGGLAKEVRHWGEWVLQKVKAEIGDLYPLIPDPEAPRRSLDGETCLPGMEPGDKLLLPGGYLTPVAYLWTRTVTCKNPACKATVPLVRQTWLCKKKDRYVALKPVAPKGAKQVRFEVVEAHTAKGLGFDPEAGSSGGNATCPFCGAVADSEYLKSEGCAERLGQQMMAIVCVRSGARGKCYLSANEYPTFVPDQTLIQHRISSLCQRTGLTVPQEPMPKQGTLGFRVQPYGIKTWELLFSPRQRLCLLSFASAIREVEKGLDSNEEDRRRAIITMLAAMLDRLADFSSTLCVWNCVGWGESTAHTFGRQALPMTWDFSEIAPFSEDTAGWPIAIERVLIAASSTDHLNFASVSRGTATALPWDAGFFDAIVTDPPYYDNVPYADLSDFFYIWLRRVIGHLYPEHFATELTPKKAEAVAEATRYEGSREKARSGYEETMARSFREAHRVLRSRGQLVVVYAHKTTLGWSTLVDALRAAGFTVSEAWPLDTEKPGRLRAQESAALASSILLVARKRDGTGVGSYATDVCPDLESIVRERVETLWEQGISGADLVIACVGAGLRAFTRFARVEYANGEEVLAERFLTEVESVVLDSILGRLSKEVGGSKTSLAGVDPPTRFYALWRYTYRSAELDAGEAIVFANGTHVELDGPNGMSAGSRALVEKKKGKYRLRDFAERGDDEKLGKPSENGQAAPLIDALHRTLWLMENRPRQLGEFLREAQPNREQMRLVAQALAGPALKGGELADISPTGELAALAKLTANWRSVIEDNLLAPLDKADRKRGERSMFE